MGFNRRQFISVAAGSAVAATTLTKASAQTLSNVLGNTAVAWEALRKIVNGNLYFPDTENFYYKAAVNNLRYMNKLPQAVAVVSSSEQAQATIKWCVSNKMPFRIKGGGHSYAGFSTCPELVISTQGLNSISIDTATGIATVGAGVINYSLYDALQKANRTITHGRCPTVGVAGFVMGGGIGFDMRRLGMACDQLVSAQIVLANGSLVKATETENKDMFWALRGGAGGNFGLATAFEFKTIDVKATTITAFQRQYQINDRDLTTDFLEHMMKSCQRMPNEFGSRISVRYIKTSSTQSDGAHFLIDLIGQWAGQQSTLNAFFDGLYDLNGQPREGIVENVLVNFTGPYWQAQDYLEDADESSFYQERSTFIDNTPKRADLAGAIRRLEKRPNVHNTCDLRFFQTGGAINDVKPDATAYVHRSNQWLAVIGFYWGMQDESDPKLIEAGHAWQDDFYGYILAQFPGKGAYQNFPDISLKDWQSAYYGSNLARLKAIKKTNDPNQLFTYQQAIPV
ncbi:hypothetical protein H4S14_001349 [Agrobacterium vitis]|nr:hypothetical protein [Agrobacterium vitis]MBE1437611.1 hypothetical protein [Agrobacterium vitis]